MEKEEYSEKGSILKALEKRLLEMDDLLKKKNKNLEEKGKFLDEYEVWLDKKTQTLYEKQKVLIEQEIHLAERAKTLVEIEEMLEKKIKEFEKEIFEGLIKRVNSSKSSEIERDES